MLLLPLMQMSFHKVTKGALHYIYTFVFVNCLIFILFFAKMTRGFLWEIAGHNFGGNKLPCGNHSVK